jgi:hypothetical protein
MSPSLWMRTKALTTWYQRSIGTWPEKRKKQLESRLIWGYPVFGVFWGLMQFTGIGDTLPAQWFSKGMAYLIPAMQTIELASPTPDRARFFYAVLWLLAIISSVMLIPLSIDLHNAEMKDRIKRHPYKSLLFIPFFAVCLGVNFFGLGSPTSLGNWKMYGSPGSSVFYGSMVMAGVPFFTASIYLFASNWRSIVGNFFPFK